MNCRLTELTQVNLKWYFKKKIKKNIIFKIFFRRQIEFWHDQLGYRLIRYIQLGYRLIRYIDQVKLK